MTTVRHSLARVFEEYRAATHEDFTDHPLADFIRQDLRNAVMAASSEAQRYRFKASCGQGNWARGPWVGVFDPVVTTSAQKGYYTSLLFREDMKGVYLSLNQAMTEAKENYKADAKTALKARAANFRALLGKQVDRFPFATIDLAPSSPHNDTAFYEAGNICAAYYEAGNLPSEDQIVADLRAMLRLYEALVIGEVDNDVVVDPDDDTPQGMNQEDATRFRMHKRIERNANLVKKVKKVKGCVCEVCKLNFVDRYGPVGLNYIEAHHLKPIASLKGTKVTMDPSADFAVLCANCHRMVHRSGLVDDIEKFKQDHFHG